ncbi:uncharacterized protein LOC111715580 [Eurytemora carolleeae]|uniref:uncharacterized protein LOC111715580 n=1 Tax=Eurytemora carolleeae TaxID=1294199 RepID=UPI000C785B92|nr:uncharacterized protein LOC111715580 [Eurytemora carolleeae]|eukprot:XP_023346707.1 uncharacterized protein LOC111715580 [Eurytemora affinis]
MQPGVNSLHHYLNKMAVVHFQLGVCVNNPCTAGTSLFVNNDGKPKCFKLKDRSVLKCTNPLSLDETSSELECPYLIPLSINTRSSSSCSGGQVWNVYRKRCVRIFI